MAFILGTETCIESLRCDLNDIQETIDEILVRCGPIKCYSWKNPDKLASDLDIRNLLERFKFGNDEVDNQFAHYSLLELIIDRLLLLICLSTNFVDTSLMVDNDNRKLPNSKSTQISAGLAIKKYWNKFTQLLSTVRQLNCQNKTLQAIKQKETKEEPSESQPSQLSKNSQAPSTRTISSEVGSKCTQTNETSFVPCEACAKVQTNLKQNADLLINMCHFQNIQSQVGKYRASLMASQLVGGWLSGPDLEKWLIEQDKDLNKLSKQIEYLSKNNELLKAKLTDNEALVQKMQETEKEIKRLLKQEQDSQSITMKQYEKKLLDQKNDMQTMIDSLKIENQKLTDLKISIDQKYDNLKNLHENNEKIIVELSENNRLISDELKLKNDQKEKLKRLEDELLASKTDLEKLKNEIFEKTNELNLEKAKLDTSIKSELSLKSKHEVLLESLDKLTAENESLIKRAKHFDEEKTLFLDTIKSKQEKLESIELEKNQLKKSIEELKLQLKKYKDNELLLLKYPDLYGPVDISESEMNVVEDMQNQINANKHRMSLLDNLNKTLFNSIKKLNEKRNSNDNSINTNTTGMSSTLNQSSSNNEPNEENYFMKHKDSRRDSLVETPKNSDRNGLGRPVPLFKLENEMELKQQDEKYWKPQASLNSTLKENSNRVKSGSNMAEQFKRESSSLNKNIKIELDNSTNNNNEDDEVAGEDDDDDDDFNFLKDKREADQSYLNKLNQINLNSELKIDNTDFNLFKNRRNISSRNHDHSFLHSPSPSSMNSERGSSSKQSNYNRAQARTTPIPPAEKGMEVIVGKGRRSSMSTSARSNSSNNGNQKTSLPPSGRDVKKINGNSKTSLVCENCQKSYTQKKDMEIHKMYCN